MDIGTPFSLYFTPPCNFGESTAVNAGAHRTSVINIGKGKLAESYLPKSVRWWCHSCPHVSLGAPSYGNSFMPKAMRYLPGGLGLLPGGFDTALTADPGALSWNYNFNSLNGRILQLLYSWLRLLTQLRRNATTLTREFWSRWELDHSTMELWSII